MDEKSLSDEISQLMSDTPPIEPASSEEKTDEQQDILADNLKAVAGETGGELETALDEFLSGKGALHEATRSALTRGGDRGLSDVISLLMKQFKLSPAMAKLIASLIMKMQSSAKDSTAKKKPRRKSKPKAATSAKKKASAKKAKKKTTAKAKKSASKAAAKKKTASKAKPRSAKKTASKTAAKKKASAKTGKKKAAARAKPKKARRSNTVEIP